MTVYLQDIYDHDAFLYRNIDGGGDEFNLRRRPLLRLIGNRHFSSIVEYGSGYPSRYLELLRGRADRLVGIDPAIEPATRHGIRYIRGSAPETIVGGELILFTYGLLTFFDDRSARHLVRRLHRRMKAGNRVIFIMSEPMEALDYYFKPYRKTFYDTLYYRNKAGRAKVSVNFVFRFDPHTGCARAEWHSTVHWLEKTHKLIVRNPPRYFLRSDAQYFQMFDAAGFKSIRRFNENGTPNATARNSYFFEVTK